MEGSRSSSTSPVSSATAASRLHSAQPELPPLRSLHQEPSHPPVNSFPCLILIGSHRHHKLTLSPKLPFAAELAAGDFLHLQRPYDHRENRPSRADPSPPSGPREEQPNAGDDRRSPAPLGQRRETTRGDWSNLTSGPLDPLSATPRRPRWSKWRRHTRNTSSLRESVISSKRFLFCFNLKTDFDQNFDWL